MGWIGNLKNENALAENFNCFDQYSTQDFGYIGKKLVVAILLNVFYNRKVIFSANSSSLNK